MKRFGFGADPPIDYPDGQMSPSGVFDVDKQEYIPVDSGRVDIGRMAIGQERLRVTPLQMATVAATVANGGMLMKARIASRIVDDDGRTVERIEPEEAERVMSEESAAQLTQMMANVVREGTGTAAALAGIEVAGKTGTAELNIPQRLNQPWFIGFAPPQQPEGRDRGDAGEHRRRAGRRRGGADRQGGHGVAAAMRQLDDRRRHRRPLQDHRASRLGRDGRRLLRRRTCSSGATSR